VDGAARTRGIIYGKGIAVVASFTVTNKPDDLRTYAGAAIVVVVVIVVFHPPVALVGALTALVAGLGRSFVQIRRFSRRR
jgi:hypothetical protein